MRPDLTGRAGHPAWLLPASLFLLLLTTRAAFAHTGVGVAGGLMGGVLHPLTGPDHLVAMVAVGIWGAELGAPAIWVLPICFPLVMAVGGALGIAGVALPLTEIFIALSALVLGSVVALRVRAPFWVAAIVVAIFAIFHGNAHGLELPESADPLAFAVGFVAATGFLHLVGITIGLALRHPVGVRVVQGVGFAIAAAGVFYLYTALTGEA